ncbi:MAG: hypothetical protein WB791_06415 [Waddliaceae bacterium]
MTWESADENRQRGAEEGSSKKLKRQQRCLSRRIRGSKNRDKIKRKIANTHYRIYCRRQDYEPISLNHFCRFLASWADFAFNFSLNFQ